MQSSSSRCRLIDRSWPIHLRGPCSLPFLGASNAEWPISYLRKLSGRLGRPSRVSLVSLFASKSHRLIGRPFIFSSNSYMLANTVYAHQSTCVRITSISRPAKRISHAFRSPRRLSSLLQRHRFSQSASTEQFDIFSNVNMVKRGLAVRSHDKWGFAIYRCTDGDDDAWERCKNIIIDRTH